MWLIPIILAGAFKAVADTLYHHFSTSVFRKLNEKWWNPDVSYKYAPYLHWAFIKTKYRIDAWHLSNSGMITAFCAAPFLYKPLLPHWSLDFALSGVVFILSFNLFYNHWLLAKK